MNNELDATTARHLRGKYAIVGIGETEYMRGSGCTTRTLGTRAVRAAIVDAGLKADAGNSLALSRSLKQS